MREMRRAVCVNCGRDWALRMTDEQRESRAKVEDALLRREPTPRQQEILALRKSGMTWEAVGKCLGISRQAAQQTAKKPVQREQSYLESLRSKSEDKQAHLESLRSKSDQIRNRIAEIDQMIVEVSDSILEIRLS